MARILEISRTPLFKACLPEQTTWFRTGATLVAGNETCTPDRLTGRRAWRLWREIRRGDYDLIVLPAVEIGYSADTKRWKRLARKIIQKSTAWGVASQVLGTLFRWDRSVVVFTDVADNPALSYETCALVPGFLAYFKRELFPSLTLRAGERWRGVNARVVPWSLFAPAVDFLPDAGEKKSDVFFAGHCAMALRQQGLSQLQALVARGYKVDIPMERLNYHEYLQRMAEAWLVWSPEGFGWDCYRHYEAAFAGAVPVINEPAHPRSRPFVDGEECFYYGSGTTELERVVIGALEDKSRLRAMAVRVRKHVLARYTRQGLVSDMQATIVEQLRVDKRASPLLQEWAGAGGAD